MPQRGGGEKTKKCADEGAEWRLTELGELLLPSPMLGVRTENRMLERKAMGEGGWTTR